MVVLIHPVEATSLYANSRDTKLSESNTEDVAQKLERGNFELQPFPGAFLKIDWVLVIVI